MIVKKVKNQHVLSRRKDIMVTIIELLRYLNRTLLLQKSPCQGPKFKIGRTILICLNKRKELTVPNVRTDDPNHRKASLF